MAEPDLARGREAIDPNESLIASGLIDSFGVLKLVSFIEKEFNIVLDDEEVTVENFDTIASIVNLLVKNHGL